MITENTELHRPNEHASKWAREAAATGETVMVLFGDGCYAYFKSAWLREQAEGKDKA